MKALIKAHKAPGLEMDDVSKPRIGHNDVLIKIEKTAICGTDIHIYNWDEWAQHTIPVPMTIGHEYVGHIVDIGSEVKGFETGDRVSGEGHITCGFCRNCRAGRRHLCRNTVGVGVNRNGAFAEFVAIPAVNVFKIADGISDDIASILDPLGNATHTVLSFDLVGEDVLITGAGPIGLMAVAIARHVGARHVVITDINDYRLGLAQQMGATVAVNVTEQSLQTVMQQLQMSEGFDIGLEMSGNISAFNQMLEVMNHGGAIAMLGILPKNASINWEQVIFKGLQLKGVYGREMFETWYKMSSLLQSGLNVNPVITHHYPVDQFQEAFDAMRQGQTGKVILDWQ